MGILEQLDEPSYGPVICTIMGDAGRGKTTLAATFPKPIFIRAEDGMKSLLPLVSKKLIEMPKAFPLIQSEQDIFDQLVALLKEDHNFETVVIDTVSALDAIFIEELLSKERPGIGLQQACGGYGNAKDVLAAKPRRIRKAAGLLRERRGMNVVFTAHTATSRVEPPDAEGYTIYTLKMHEKSVAPYVDDVDLVGLLRLETFVKGKDGEQKRAISDGTRVLACVAEAASVAKNRLGITDLLTVEEGKNPLADYLPKPKAAAGGAKKGVAAK